MNCEKIKLIMISYLEGDLSGADKEEVGRHIEGCPHCQGEMKLLSQTWQLLDGYSVPKLREGFTSSVMKRIHEETPEPAPAAFGIPVFSASTLVLASIALALAGVLVFPQLFPADRFAHKGVKSIQTQVVSEAPDEIDKEQALVTYLIGTVKVLLEGQQEYADAEEGMVLKSGDAVMTGPGGTMELSFDSENSRIVKVQADTKAAITLQGDEKMMLYDGEVFATIHNLPAHSSFEIRTPTAVTGARGTAWATSVSEGSTTIESFERTPYIKNIEATGLVSDEETKVAAGYSTVVGHLQKPQPLRPIQAEKVARYNSLISDIRQHAKHDLVTQQMRPKFDRNDFIKNIAGGKERKSEAGMRNDRREPAGSGPGTGSGPDKRRLPKAGPGVGGLDGRADHGPDERGRREEKEQYRQDRVDRNGDGVVNTDELNTWSGRPGPDGDKGENKEGRGPGQAQDDRDRRQDGRGMGEAPGMGKGPGIGQGERGKAPGKIMDSGSRGGPGGEYRKAPGAGPGDAQGVKGPRSGDQGNGSNMAGPVNRPGYKGPGGSGQDQGQGGRRIPGGQGQGLNRGGPSGQGQGPGKTGPGARPGGNRPGGGPGRAPGNGPKK